jgi:signal transduction histidine kinase/ActR/RegA family two-component response regulator
MSDAESLEIARQFVANSPFPLSLLDLEGCFLEFSPALVQMITAADLSREALIGKPAGALVASGEHGVRDAFARLAAGDHFAELDRSLSLYDGRLQQMRVQVRVQGSYWRNPKGEPIAVLFIHNDASAEIEAQTAQRNIETQLRAVVDNIPSQIALVDLEAGVVELMNAGLVAAAANELIRAPDRMDLAAIRPDRVAQLKAGAEAAEAAGGIWETEREISDRHGRKRWGRVKHILFDDAAGRRRVLWIADDITELTEATEGLKRAVAEAEAANRAKSEFLANMSHEIRTPLNGVMGVAGALARTRLTAAQQEMVAIVETSAKTLETLLSDILDVARIEAGKLEIRPEPFDLEASVGACATLFDAAAQAKGLDLKLEVAPEARGAYLGDAARIRQILSNLLGNAVKFTQAGEVVLRITAERGPVSSELAFEVRDTGIGFDAETKARLFSRFEQADGSITRRFGGSGLGLSISRSLAEAMGGRLEAAAKPGAGAVFTLWLELPRCDEMRLAAQAPAAEAALLEDANPLAGMRVLVAEDHPTNRRVVELILGVTGVDLICVEDGAQAVEAFRAGRFDLILMDMQMPVMDGLTAIRAIRALEALSAAPRTLIHVLTANAMPEHVNASLAAGADGHLSKPIVADTLLARVAEAAALLGAGQTPDGWRPKASAPRA